jgi:NOL1/NOP2/sun family putative RNA methylase
MALDRYLDIIPDPARFRRALERPEPTTVRVRTGRVATAGVVERLEGRGFGLEPVPGLPDVFHVRAEPRPISKTLEHWMGHFYIQQASTAVAAPALGARPGERTLDLCAAPGGKTTHLADLMEGRGCLVASDRDEKRIRALLGNVYRLGHAGILAVAADGRAFPAGAAFDRVLVDAPCSAEGNVRRQGGEVDAPSEAFHEYATGLQEALLRRAVALTRPGGTILYSTCTFAPEENEAVVDAVLADLPVRLEPIGLEVPHAPGLTAFGGRRFHPDMELAWRLYPHHLDSGGLFMARLRKAGTDVSEGGGEDERGGARRGWSPVPEAFPGEPPGPAEAAARVADGKARLSESFGVAPRRLEATGWMVRGNSLWGHTLDAWPLDAWEPSPDWRFVSLGVRVMRTDRRYGFRPTNDGLRWLGPDLGRRVVELDLEDGLRLLEGAPIAADVEGGNGNVALALHGEVVGRGVLRHGVVRPEIRSGRARQLTEILMATLGYSR